MKLDRWVPYGNCLIGYVYDDPCLDSGQRVITEAIRFIDPINMYAETLNDRFNLINPGTLDEHNLPILGNKYQEVTLDQMKESVKHMSDMFLNPHG